MNNNNINNNIIHNITNTKNTKVNSSISTRRNDFSFINCPSEKANITSNLNNYRLNSNFRTSRNNISNLNYTNNNYVVNIKVNGTNNQVVKVIYSPSKSLRENDKTDSNSNINYTNNNIMTDSKKIKVISNILDSKTNNIHSEKLKKEIGFIENFNKSPNLTCKEFRNKSKIVNNINIVNNYNNNQINNKPNMQVNNNQIKSINLTNKNDEQINNFNKSTNNIQSNINNLPSDINQINNSKQISINQSNNSKINNNNFNQLNLNNQKNDNNQVNNSNPKNNNNQTNDFNKRNNNNQTSINKIINTSNQSNINNTNINNSYQINNNNQTTKISLRNINNQTNNNKPQTIIPVGVNRNNSSKNNSNIVYINQCKINNNNNKEKEKEKEKINNLVRKESSDSVTNVKIKLTKKITIAKKDNKTESQTKKEFSKRSCSDDLIKDNALIFCDICNKNVTNFLFNTHYLSHPTQIFKWLFLGSCKNAFNNEELINIGITHVLNCAMEINDDNLPKNIKYLHIKIIDTIKFNILSCFEKTNKFIEEARTFRNGKILIHCKFGISRSASILIGYLIKYYGYTVNSAIEFIKKKRKKINPNQGFMKQLNIFEKKIKGRRDLSTESTNDLFYGCLS